MKIVLVTGGFDPLHSGHISYFKEAKQLGDYLVVGLNSDEWLTRKKGRPFMPLDERTAIVSALACVDEVITFNDSDNTACDAIHKVINFWKTDEEIIFANGGDRKLGSVPEEERFGNYDRISFSYGVGGNDKKNSSSWILDEWKTQKTERDWGYWRVLDDKPDKGYKVKELVIEPGKSLSDQRHFIRSEDWIVLEGIVKMDTEWDGIKESVHLRPGGLTYKIGKEVWHKASNPGNDTAHILEVQWGTKCIEEDIERR
jgi:D-beta-D-heptose 7-phosphate kinase/D-beta-D-heptose 1-phosphate adenosyltransferase